MAELLRFPTLQGEPIPNPWMADRYLRTEDYPATGYLAQEQMMLAWQAGDQPKTLRERARERLGL